VFFFVFTFEKLNIVLPRGFTAVLPQSPFPCQSLVATDGRLQVVCWRWLSEQSDLVILTVARVNHDACRPPCPRLSVQSVLYTKA